MANKQEKRYELTNNSAEQEEAEMKQPPKKIEQITLRDIMEALKAISEQPNTFRTEINDKFDQQNDNHNKLMAKFDQQNDKFDQFRTEINDNYQQQNGKLDQQNTKIEPIKENNNQNREQVSPKTEESSKEIENKENKSVLYLRINIAETKRIISIWKRGQKNR